MQIDFNSSWNKWKPENTTPENSEYLGCVQYIEKARNNLKRIGKLADSAFKGYKLSFRTDGDIDTDRNSLMRSGKGLLQTGINIFSDKKISDWNEDIYCLNAFIDFMENVFIKDLKATDRTILQSAVDGLKKLNNTYEEEKAQGQENKVFNESIVTRAIHALSQLKEASERKEKIEILLNELRKKCTNADKSFDFEKFRTFSMDLNYIVNFCNNIQLIEFTNVINKKNILVFIKESKEKILQITAENKKYINDKITKIDTENQELLKIIEEKKSLINQIGKEILEEKELIEQDIFDQDTCHKQKLEDFEKQFHILEKEIKDLEDKITLKNNQISKFPKTAELLVDEDIKNALNQVAENLKQQ